MLALVWFYPRAERDTEWTCGLCGGDTIGYTELVASVRFVREDNGRAVCGECAEREAPVLYALASLAYTAAMYGMDALDGPRSVADEDFPFGANAVLADAIAFAATDRAQPRPKLGVLDS
jgi:citrate lyase beta subunit